MATSAPAVKTGTKAPPFALKATDGKTYSLEQLKGAKGMVVMFICNHCPYVKAVIERLVSDMKELQAQGVGVAAIMSNDTHNYPEDSFENMKRFAQMYGFTFPYMIDETQEIAHAYGAICTPDFFGFNMDLELQYRGRLDDAGKSSGENSKRELLIAMQQVVAEGKTDQPQMPSIGCSIKWKH